MIQKYGPFYYLEDFNTNDYPHDDSVVDVVLNTRPIDCIWFQEPKIVTKGRYSSIHTTPSDLSTTGNSSEWTSFLSEDFLFKNKSNFKRVKIGKSTLSGKRLISFILRNPISEEDWEKEGLMGVFGGYGCAKPFDDCANEKSFVKLPKKISAKGIVPISQLDSTCLLGERFSEVYADDEYVYAKNFQFLDETEIRNLEFPLCQMKEKFNLSKKKFSFESEDENFSNMAKDEYYVLLSEKNIEKYKNERNIYVSSGGYVVKTQVEDLAEGDVLFYRSKKYHVYENLEEVHSLYEYKTKPKEKFMVFWKRVGDLKGEFSLEKGGISGNWFYTQSKKNNVFKSFFPRIWKEVEAKSTYETFLLEKSVTKNRWSVYDSEERKRAYPKWAVPLNLFKDDFQMPSNFYFHSNVDQRDYFVPITFERLVEDYGFEVITDALPKNWRQLFDELISNESLRQKIVTGMLLS